MVSATSHGNDGKYLVIELPQLKGSIIRTVASHEMIHQALEGIVALFTPLSLNALKCTKVHYSTLHNTKLHRVRYALNLTGCASAAAARKEGKENSTQFISPSCPQAWASFEVDCQ